MKPLPDIHVMWALKNRKFGYDAFKYKYEAFVLDSLLNMFISPIYETPPRTFEPFFNTSSRLTASSFRLS